jgi:predicted TIM-barrel fold metal-dependent hydrolase
MQQQALEHIQRLTTRLAAVQSDVVIDSDTHATDILRNPRLPVEHYYHGRPLSAEDLIAEMDLAGVSMANTWQNPASTTYPGGEDENAEALLEANRYIRDVGLRYPDRFIPSGWTDPKACGVSNACRLAEIYVREFGFAVVKMNPAQNRFRIDSPEVIRVVDTIVELGDPGVPLWRRLAVHTGVGSGGDCLPSPRTPDHRRSHGRRRRGIRRGRRTVPRIARVGTSAVEHQVSIQRQARLLYRRSAHHVSARRSALHR